MYNRVLVHVSSCPIVTTMLCIYTISCPVPVESELDEVNCVCVYMYSFLIVTMVVEPALVCKLKFPGITT